MPDWPFRITTSEYVSPDDAYLVGVVREPNGERRISAARITGLQASGDYSVTRTPESAGDE